METSETSDPKFEEPSKIEEIITEEIHPNLLKSEISDAFNDFSLSIDEDPSKNLNLDGEYPLFENFEASSNDFFDETPLSNFSQECESLQSQDTPQSPSKPSSKRKISEILENSNDTEFSSQSFEEETEFQPTNYQQNYSNSYYPQYQNHQQSWQYHNYLQQQSHYGFIPQHYSNYSYNVYTQPIPPQPATIAYVQSEPQPPPIKSPKNLVCKVCVRAFKTTSNLLRHFNSKTHQKKMTSKKQSRNYTETSKITHGSVTDVSEEEKKILWQIDDEIYEFLNELEIEKNSRGKMMKIEIFPTPPLSPSVKI